jgi:hypothetical protein
MEAVAQILADIIDPKAMEILLKKPGKIDLHFRFNDNSYFVFACILFHFGLISTKLR